MSVALKAEVVVLGGGVAIAYELARRNREVIVIYRDDDGSSFRNQKWKHSGLLYAPTDLTLAKECWKAYRESEESDLESPRMGDMGMGYSNRWDERKAYFLALTNATLVDREQRWSAWRKQGLSCGRYRRLRYDEFPKIGDLETKAIGGFLTPDCVMNFPLLVREMRARTSRLLSERQNLRPVFRSGAEVTRINRGSDGIEIQYVQNGQNGLTECAIECRHCIMCLGAWTPKALSEFLVPSLDRALPIVLRACIVLQYEVALVPTVTVFLMDDQQLQLTEGGTSGPSLVPFEGKTLVCDTRFGIVEPGQVDEVYRAADYHDRDGASLREMLQGELTKCFKTKLPAEVHSSICVKAEGNRDMKSEDLVSSSPDLEMKVWGPESHGVPGLTVALPGKASLAFPLANEIASRIDDDFRRRPNGTRG